MKSKASSFIKSRAAESVETRAYMVRNYQDGYPFLNLAFFFCWKYPETSIYLVKMIGRWIPDGEGRGIARDI